MIEAAAGPWNVLDHGVRKISTLDFDLAVETAVVATGLLAATQVGAWLCPAYDATGSHEPRSFPPRPATSFAVDS